MSKRKRSKHAMSTPPQTAATNTLPPVVEQETLPSVAELEQENLSAKTERTPRNLDTRATSVRDDNPFVPASILPVPESEPGIDFRWIRTSMVGKADNKNVSQQFREGWVPVKAKEYPELMVESDFDSRFTDSGNLEVGGLLLCKAPTEMMDKRKKYYADKANRQIETIDHNYMNENDPRMPLSSGDISRRTEFGRG